MELITNYEIQPSYARTREPNRAPVRSAWCNSVTTTTRRRAPGGAGRPASRMAAAEGADVVCLSELTLSPYFCFNRRVHDNCEQAARKIC